MTELDGKRVSEKVRQDIKEEIAFIKEKTGKTPGLAVIIVGDDPAAKIYVGSKDKAAAELGVRSYVLEFSREVPQEEIIRKINELNEDREVHGVLVQTPLPPEFDAWKVLDTLDPAKDVDCFHPVNLGRVLLGRSRIFPCTPAGIIKILDHYGIDVAGMNAAVIGRSFIVGKPLAAMLTNRNATVTICHSQTKDLPAVVKQADLVVAAVGSPGFVTPAMVRDKAILVDVGINRLDKEENVLQYCSENERKKFFKRGYGICGDIHKDAYGKSSYYTPVPGGVGVMTVTMLMYNTLHLFKEHAQGGRPQP